MLNLLVVFRILAFDLNTMNILKLSSIVTAYLFLLSCSNTDSQSSNTESAGQNQANESQLTQPVPSSETPAQPQTDASTPATISQPVVSANSASAVFHYICPNKCAGGGSEGQGKCPVCKTDLIHNDAFHNQPQQQPQINMQPQTNAIQLNNPNPTPPAPTAEAPQNAKGVWHYTCPKGCAGGGGQAIACTNCGTQLEHNQKYHE